MDDKRLQEIKDLDWLLHGNEEWTNREDADTEAVILELITAHKNQGELLQLSLANVDRLNEELAAVMANRDALLEICNSRNDDIADLRKQLAEVEKPSRDWQHEYFEAKSELKSNQYTTRQIPDLRKQLARLLEKEKRMQAEHSISMDNYEKQLAEAKAEVERITDAHRDAVDECERLRKAIDLFGDQPPDCSPYWKLGA